MKLSKIRDENNLRKIFVTYNYNHPHLAEVEKSVVGEVGCVPLTFVQIITQNFVVSEIS